MRIIPFQPQYRDDMIFMVLEAKNALGRVPRLNEDLLDVPKNYLEQGDMFWLALDEGDRVIGCVGCNLLTRDEAKLHRLYVKYDRKRQGVGSALLETAETHLRARGVKRVSVHLGDSDYWESRLFYPARGYVEAGPDCMQKEF